MLLKHITGKLIIHPYWVGPFSFQLWKNWVPISPLRSWTVSVWDGLKPRRSPVAELISPGIYKDPKRVVSKKQDRSGKTLAGDGHTHSSKMLPKSGVVRYSMRSHECDPQWLQINGTWRKVHSNPTTSLKHVHLCIHTSFKPIEICSRRTTSWLCLVSANELSTDAQMMFAR